MIMVFFNIKVVKCKQTYLGISKIVFLRNTTEFFVRIEEKKMKKEKKKKFQKDELELVMNDSIFSIFEIRKRDWIGIEKIE